MAEKGASGWLKKCMTISLLAGTIFTQPCIMPAAMASGGGDAWAIAAEALGVAAAYTSCLHEILTMGNDAGCQFATLQQDIKAHGADGNVLDTDTVNAVMRQLTQHGVYVLDARSLPFRWRVNDNEEFNACCYPTDYVSVNRGLVRGLGCNEDELAAVLAHEMTHGLRQHSAHNYAKAMAQFYGMAFLNMTTGAMDGNVMAALADYSIAKNVTLPTEYEADEGGFYLMTSAGFNPGGSAAAMARMQHFEENLSSYLGSYDPYDHPDTDKRELRLAKLLTEYSCGHVTVKDRREIQIDGKTLLTAVWTTEEYNNTPENAYFIAGGLAKAFHASAAPAAWNFHVLPGGRLTFLTDDRAYTVLKDFAASRHVEELLQKLVTEAYAGEKISGARKAMQAAEQERLQEQEKLREKCRQTDKKNVRMMRVNGDLYNDLGLPDYGLAEVDRAFACTRQDDLAETYSIRGRSKAMLGDFDGAFADCNKAIALNGKSPYNYLNRADAYRSQGNRAAALQDCEQAAKIDAKLPDTYKMMAVLQDEQADKDGALQNYRKYYELAPQAKDIPEEYLLKIAPQVVQKARDAELKKEQEEKLQKAEQEKTEKEQMEKEKQEEQAERTQTAKPTKQIK